MEIGLIFKIAAVGILVTILSQILKHSGSRRADSGADLDHPLYL